MHKRVHKYGLENHARAIQKMKHMVGKHDTLCGAMVWPHHALVKIRECFPYVVMRAFHKTNHHQRKFHGFEGEITKIEGGSKFPLSFVHGFFYDEHTTCKSPCSNLALFRVHLPYLGDYVHFLGM